MNVIFYEDSVLFNFDLDLNLLCLCYMDLTTSLINDVII